MNLQEFGEYLKKIRKNKDISLRQVDYSSEVTFSNLSMIESGKRKATPFILKELSKVYHIDYIDLLEKAGYIDLAEAEKINNKTNNVFPIADTPIRIPILGKISAGLPILATENIEGYEFAPSSQIKEGFEYFYLRVNGDSMNLKFNDGDIVLVQKQDTLENDEIGVILVDDEATVKKFKQENGMIILYPMSTNSEHSVQIYKTEQIKIIGKVISYQGRI